MPLSTEHPYVSDERRAMLRSRGALRRRLPWALLSLALMLLVTAMTLHPMFLRLERHMQETAERVGQKSGSKDIVIVSIDPKSIQELGAWPWRRNLHAELLDRISAGSPRCIGLDVFLTGPDAANPDDDAALVRALQAAPCTVLPLSYRGPRPGSQDQSEVLPAPAFANAATALGQAHLSIDGDGIAHGFYRHEGFAGRMWPHFSLAMQQAANGTQPAAERALDRSRAVTLPYTEKWRREGLELLLQHMPSTAFHEVSYVDVLRGTVSPEVFRDRYVLVGATTESLMGLYATDAPTQRGLVPGVDVFANALDGLIANRHIRVADSAQNLVFNLLPLAIALIGLLWLRPLGVIALIAVLLLGREFALIAQPWIGLRLLSVPGHVGLLLIYPLWSLMRQTAALRFLQRGALELRGVLADLPGPDTTEYGGDYLDRQIAATDAAFKRVRDLHRFIRDGVDHLPDATLILNRSGIVFSANVAAGKHWGTEACALVGQDAHGLLAGIRARSNRLPMITPGVLRAREPAPIVGEGEDAAGRNVLLRCVPFLDVGNAYAGWMIAIVDITRLRRMQTQREESLRFISHDIREPSASILTVIELARAQPELMPRDLMLRRIERHARTGLELADGFVNLARAEAQPFRPELVDLVAMLHSTVDGAWANARARGVRIRFECELEEATCLGDCSLLPRALTNVMSNALKYSPSGSTVDCRIVERGTHWALSIRDQGPGIPVDLQAQLFQPFHRLHSESHPEVQGVGLGLLLVRTIVQRHGGTVEIESAENAGCAVTLLIPKPTAAILKSISNLTQEN